MRLFNPEQEAFVRKEAWGKTVHELTLLVNQTFGTSFTEQQIRSWKKRHRVSSGFSGQFQKGHTSWNKGKKMPDETRAKVKRTWFPKGNRPKNAWPVNTEVVTTDGFIKVKIAEPNVWKLKHHIVWEQAYGERPKGYGIRFKDGNRLNCELDNLILLSNRERAICNKHFGDFTGELTLTGIALGKLKSIVCQKQSK